MADAAEPGNVAADLFTLLAADPLARHLGITLEQVGLGQLGGSLAAALVTAGRTVSGWDVDPAARDAAETRGVRITRDLTGVVVLAVPLPAMSSALVGLTVDPQSTVTDLGSVKQPVL